MGKENHKSLWTMEVFRGFLLLLIFAAQKTFSSENAEADNMLLSEVQFHPRMRNMSDGGEEAVIMQRQSPGATTDCRQDGKEIVRLVNDYRAQNGLPHISLSCSLCTVARYKVENGWRPNWTGRWACNFHSVDWNCMWAKPRQLTGYNGYGYENWAYASPRMNPSQAFRQWQGSSGHNAVMLNQGIWTDSTWRAIGAAISPSNGQASLWFGEKSDFTSC